MCTILNNRRNNIISSNRRKIKTVIDPAEWRSLIINILMLEAQVERLRFKGEEKPSYDEFKKSVIYNSKLYASQKRKYFPKPKDREFYKVFRLIFGNWQEMRDSELEKIVEKEHEILTRNKR